ncbi:MAG: hypothetical protein J6Y07_04095 [Alphaproteobacteria bacterium]|nr:hypothetical protein [Alphaproteobacteria bacterium]
MSHSGIIQRVEKTSDNKYGIKRIKAIPPDETCVLYLGGNGTKSEREASGNAKIIEKDILPYLPTKVPVYSAYYNANIHNMWFDWGTNFSKYGYNFVESSKNDNGFLWVKENNLKRVVKDKILPRMIDKTGKPFDTGTAEKNLKKLYIVFDGYGLRKKMEQMLHTVLTNCGVYLKDLQTLTKHIATNSFSVKDLDFEYINTLFEQTILPRISDGGRRLPLDKAMARIRKINIVAHCHGTYLVQKMEEKMQARMLDLGYNQSEIKQVLSQVLVIAHAPIIPLGVSKFRIISFTTAHDSFAARPQNWVTKYVKYNQENEKDPNWLRPCFLSGRNGDVFIIRNAFEPLASNGKPSSFEHDSAFYEPQLNQTAHGKEMNIIAGNILKNAIRNSLNKTFTSLPPIEELVLNGKDDIKTQTFFKELKANGRSLMTDIYTFATLFMQEEHTTKQTGKSLEPKR